MKHFLDQEFIEGFHKPLFGKRRHFIDLISIGIVREDLIGYYAISTDFNPRDANPWVKEHVLSKLPSRTSPLWKSNREIRADLLNFFRCTPVGNPIEEKWKAPKDIEIWGYYADYDWVLFCSLFGRMIDLPEEFPMYCRDLKQMMDEKAVEPFTLIRKAGQENYILNDILEEMKKDTRFPRNNDEHHARNDAEWNRRLYEYLDRL